VRSGLAAAAVSLAVGLAGCDLKGALLVPPGAATGPSTTTTRTATTTAVTSADAGTATGPGSTTAGTGTTATGATGTTTTPALPGTGRPTIALGDQNTPEQFVLGELYRIALSDQGYAVTITQNIGTSTTSVQALSQGTLDLYPAYLNQWDSQVAGDGHEFRTEADALVAGESFALGHGMELLNPTPFSDTDGIAVSSWFAGKHDLGTLAGLNRLSDAFTLGAPLWFSASGGGLTAVEQGYGFFPSSTQPVDIGLQYQELAAGTVQAAFVQTSDWQLALGQFRLLDDPRHVLGFGNVVPVTTNAVAIAEGPAFIPTINRVSALLTTKTIRELNQDVTLLGESPEDVASAFLESNGIYPPTD
jgi:glycine betaine/choline ABC-type transport system substrate-binding protein